MKISTQIKGQNNSFKKRQLDDAYWAMKNPEKIESKTDRRYIEQLIKAKPDWEKDDDFVHRLKQDTIKARMRGELKYKWHEFDTSPLVSVLIETFTFFASCYFLIKNTPKSNKLLLGTAFLFSPILIADNLKYIFTGKSLFEKNNATPYNINKTVK